jgi:hypothetical protein
LFKIGGQNDQPAVVLNSLQQITGLLVRVTVPGVTYIGTLSEQRIRFIKKQDPALVFSNIKNFGQVFPGLPDVFADDLTQVDPVQLLPGIYLYLAVRKKEF